MNYYGSTENFKSRYSQHKSSINKRPALHTTLSSYVWKLKDNSKPFEIVWSIIARGHSFSSGGRSCDLCISEKLTISTADQSTMLNKRYEMLETCRHRRKHLLVSLKEPIDPGWSLTDTPLCGEHGYSFFKLSTLIAYYLKLKCKHPDFTTVGHLMITQKVWNKLSCQAFCEIQFLIW